MNQRTIGIEPFNNPGMSKALDSITAARNSVFASKMFDHLNEMIAEFQAGLAENEEVGAQLTNFGQALTIHIESLGYQNPHMITFHGRTQNGDTCTLIQHMNQLSVLLVALKVPTGQKAKRIGFESHDPDAGDSAAQP